MSIIDDAIGLFSPSWKAARLKSRVAIRAYEAVLPTRTHRARRENRNANQLSQVAGRSLREQARYLDNNHDLVIGLLDKLEERIIGAKGISNMAEETARVLQQIAWETVTLFRQQGK